MKKLLISFCVIALLTGCASVGHMNEQNVTAVQLSKNNYKVIKAGATGKSTGFSLLGFIPIVSPTFSDAKADLYQSVDTKLEGRSIALANHTKDYSSLYLILFSIPRLTITADVVEFTGSDDIITQNQAKSAAALARSTETTIKKQQTKKGIILTNNETIYGEILEMSIEKVKIKTSDGIVKTYPFNEVQSFIQ